MPSLFYWMILVVLVASYALIPLYSKLAPSLGLMDTPNARSSHSQPKPRGAGIVFVLTSLVAIGWLYWLFGGLPPVFWGVVFAGGSIAVLGFADDMKELPAWQKLVFHIAAALIAMMSAGGFPTLNIGGYYLEMGTFGAVLATIFIIWCLNAYNFMDGIDGIAGSQAVFFLLSAGILVALQIDAGFLLLSVILSAGVGGFLIWNWAPSRVMMGDAGSGFLGISIGLLTIYGANVLGANLWPFIILMSVFFVDAKITLMRRLWRREKIYQAHRMHAYQHAAIKYRSHGKVVAGVWALNLFWVLPMAIGATLAPNHGVYYYLITIIPLALLARKFNAGKKEEVSW